MQIGIANAIGRILGGSSGFSPPVIDYDSVGDLFFHMRPRDETTITTDGSNNVTEIRDYNGGSGKIVQHAGTNTVLSGTRTEFGRNVLDFDGSTNSVLDMLSQMPGLDTLFHNEITVYAVVKYDSADANSYFIGAEASGGPDRIWFGNFKVWSRNVNATIDQPPIAQDTYPHIMTMTRSAADDEIAAYMDGEAFTDSPDDTSVDLSALNTITLGGLNPSGANTPNIYMEDMLIYNGIHDAATMKKVWDSLSYECNVPLLYDDYDVFLLAGQSNMAGQSEEVITSPDQPYNPHIMQVGRNGSYDERVIAAVQELDHAGGANGIGLGMKFAQLYSAANPSKKILLVPAAEGSTGFVTGDWNKGQTNYEDAKDRSNNALTHGTGTHTFKGILWHQGEADSSRTEVQYAGDLDQFISDIRTDITGASATTPVVIGELTPNFPGGSGVKAAIADTDNRVSDVYVVQNDGITDRGDNIHLDADSLNTYGQRYYDGYLSLIAPASNVVTNSGEDVTNGGIEVTHTP